MTREGAAGLAEGTTCIVPRARAAGNHTFFTNSDFSPIAPIPSILQSMS